MWRNLGLLDTRAGLIIMYIAFNSPFAIFLLRDELMPVTTGWVCGSYYNFTQRFGRDWSLTSAGAVMMIAPVLVLFLALQRQFVTGLTQGGIKL